MTNRMNKVNKVRRNKAINAFRELSKILPVDIICNTLMYFNSPLPYTKIGKSSVEYSIYNKYNNLFKAVARYKTIEVDTEDKIYIVRRYVRGFGGCVESFSIKNTGDFILGIVNYGDLISHNTTVNTIDGDVIVARPCGELCLMENEDYDTCKRCSSNPFCTFIK